MMETQTLLTVGGILLSFLFFLVGYRKTIGARRERARSANKESIEVLLKRLVLEGFSPSKKDLELLLKGKAREHLVKKSDVLLVLELIENVFTRVLENDFIEKERRDRILSFLGGLLETRPSALPASVVESARTRSSWSSFFLAVSSSIAAATMVGVFAQFYGDYGFSKDVALPVISVFLGATGLLSALTMLRRVKEQEEDTRSPKGRPIDEKHLERLVVEMLTAHNFSVVTGEGTEFDIRFETPNGLYFIEIKRTLQRLRPEKLTHLVKRLSDLVRSRNGQKGLIVSGDALPERALDVATDDVWILDLPAFLRFLEDA